MEPSGVPSRAAIEAAITEGIDAVLPAGSLDAFRIGPLLIQTGSITASGTADVWGGTVMFPTVYSATPRVFVSGTAQAAGNIVWNAFSFTPTSFNWRAVWNDLASHSSAGTGAWLAIGLA